MGENRKSRKPQNGQESKINSVKENVFLYLLTTTVIIIPLLVCPTCTVCFHLYLHSWWQSYMVKNYYHYSTKNTVWRLVIFQHGVDIASHLYCQIFLILNFALVSPCFYVWHVCQHKQANTLKPLKEGWPHHGEPWVGILTVNIPFYHLHHYH